MSYVIIPVSVAGQLIASPSRSLAVEQAGGSNITLNTNNVFSIVVV